MVPDPDRQTIQDALDRELVRRGIQKLWDGLKNTSPKVVTETEIPGKGKRVKFAKSKSISLGEAFQFMQFYPLIYGEEKEPTEFDLPIAGEIQKFKLANEKGGTFSLKAIRKDGREVDLSDLQGAVDELSDPNLKDALRNTIETVSKTLLEKKLNEQPDFIEELTKQDKTGTITTQERDDAFRATIDFFAGSSIKRNQLAGLNPSDWLKTTNKALRETMEVLKKELSKKISNVHETKLKFEFTLSMLKTSQQAIDEWEN